MTKRLASEPPRFKRWFEPGIACPRADRLERDGRRSLALNDGNALAIDGQAGALGTADTHAFGNSQAPGQGVRARFDMEHISASAHGKA